MEKEISSGAMLGIVLIALAAIIGIGFGVFAIAKGTANTGVTNVQEKLESVSQSDYTDYDQTIVTGTQVKSAYDNFAGKSAAVLIATQAVKDKMTDRGLADSAAGIKKAYESVNKVPYVYAFADYNSGAPSDKYVMSTSKNGVDAVPLFINYNALLASAADQTKNSTATTGSTSLTVSSSTLASSNTPWIAFDNNCFRCTSGYCTEAGKVQFNYITGNMSKSGMVEYLPTSARFQSYLVKDASGTTIGVCFEQISSK